MLGRTAERFSLRPDWLVADTVYGSEESLVEIVLKRQILPFIPVIDKGERTDGTLSRSDFTWDDENDRSAARGAIWRNPAYRSATSGRIRLPG
jgi:hypothetical protein